MAEIFLLLGWQGQIALVVSVAVLILVLVLLVACVPGAGSRIGDLIEQIGQLWRR